MHQKLAAHQTLEINENCISDLYLSTIETETSETSKITWFKTQYSDCMELYVDTETVAKHFASHRSWFCQCAHPMKVEPLGENGYDLLVGKFGSFGYFVTLKRHEYVNIMRILLTITTELYSCNLSPDAIGL